MGSILKRTVFMERTGDNSIGYFRVFDWALCLTTLGTMAEPFVMNQRYGKADPSTPTIATGDDLQDDMNMINEITLFDSDKHLTFLSDGGVHGGNLIPRIGR